MTTVDNNVMTGFSDLSRLEGNIPYHLQCETQDCHNFGSFRIVRQDNTVDLIACIDHVAYGDLVKIHDIVIQTNSHGNFSILSPGRETFAFTPEFNDTFRKFTLPAQIAQAIAVREALTLRRDAVSALENFKQTVVDTTVSWDGGCREGKTEFLEALGLSYPKKNVTITVTFEYEGDPNDISAYDVECYVNNALDNVDSMYVDIDWD